MKIQVQVYDPAVDDAPHVVKGEIEHRDKMTALEALMDFSNQVAYVNFEYSCKQRFCGRCSMMVDGQPCLACVTPIDDGPHVFEPLEGFPIIRDLIVDRTGFDDKISNTINRVRVEDCTEEESRSCDFPADTKERIYSMNWCCRCGVCDAGCPVKKANPDEYVGPAQMLATAFRYLDPYDQGDRVLEAVNNGLFRCMMCGTCDSVCAQDDIKHVEMWQILRDAAKERGLVPSYAKE